MEKEFCKDCKHKNINVKIKTLFNEHVQKTFIICPLETTDLIAGCFNKGLEIDWSGFKTFCKEKKLINTGEEI